MISIFIGLVEKWKGTFPTIVSLDYRISCAELCAILTFWANSNYERWKFWSLAMVCKQQQNLSILISSIKLFKNWSNLFDSFLLFCLFLCWNQNLFRKLIQFEIDFRTIQLNKIFAHAFETLPTIEFVWMTRAKVSAFSPTYLFQRIRTSFCKSAQYLSVNDKDIFICV